MKCTSVAGYEMHGDSENLRAPATPENAALAHCVQRFLQRLWSRRRGLTWADRWAMPQPGRSPRR
jgi:hypothetical protein